MIQFLYKLFVDLNWTFHHLVSAELPLRKKSAVFKMNLCSTSKNHSYSATVVILLKVVTKGMKTTLLTYF